MYIKTIGTRTKSNRKVNTMEKLRFFISRYVDGNYEIETKHIHYAFRDDLNFDDITPDKLGKIMESIMNTLKAENIEPYFVMI